MSSEQRDSLKVVVLGNEGVGKTALIHQLLSKDGITTEKKSIGLTDPTSVTEEASANGNIGRTSSHDHSSMDPIVALDMYEWELPSSEQNCGDSSSSKLKKLTVWDFKGHQQFHAVQEMFFTPETLYLVVWDMAAQDIQPLTQERCCGIAEPPPPPRCSFGSQTRCTSSCSSAFRLDYDSDSDSDDDCELDLYNQEEVRRLKRALDQDIDDKVQAWIDRIQARVPGATILPVATYADKFWTLNDFKEGKKRCKSLKERLLSHENCRYQDLMWRIQSGSSSEGGGHKETCRWVKNLAHRPRILFGSSQDEQLLSHQVCTKDGMGMGCFREFLLSSASDLADPSQQGRPLQCSSTTRAVLRDTCRSMKRHFKIVQAQYFLRQYGKEHHQEIQSALKSLHLTGELCYFRCRAGKSNSDLVILDPVWLVESVNFMLRNGASRFATSNVVSDLSDSVCQSFKLEMKSLWKNRPSTKLGLELAEQISSDAPDLIFDFVASLLARHDIVVPLSFCKGSKDMFMPNHVSLRDFHADCGSDCTANCPLVHLRAANVFSRSLSHGLTFMDRVPTSLMERISVHTMRILDAEDVDNLGISIQEYHCWKNSYHIKLALDNGKTDGPLMEVQSFLLHAPEDDAPSHAVSCKSLFVTSIQVPAVSCDVTKQVCRSIRRGMQYALDEMPGLEYKDEGVCPECLSNKTAGEIGTWTFPRIRAVLHDHENTIRCRNGHCVDVDQVQGLITFDLDFPKPDFSCCVPVPEVLSIVTSGVSQSVSENTCNSLDKSADGTRSLSGEFGRIKPCLKMRRSKTVPSTVTTSVPAVVKSSPATSSSSSVDISPDGDDQDKLQEVKKAIQAYECGSKKRFFAMKKSKLNLSGLQLREKHLPLQDLVGTPLGLSVQHLSLSHNLFETLPPSLVVSLPNLKSLDLSNCCISNLPIKWDVPKLKKLNLSNNRLSSFPGEEMLRGMPELEELNLSCNQLKKAKIPQGPLLCKLKNLDLSTNLISSLPKDLVRLSALRVFDIQNNPVKEVPVDIVSSMNGFLLEAVSDQPMKGKKAAWSGSQRAKKSMWNSKGLSMGDDSSMEGKRFSAPRMKQVSITRSTQNTVPVEDISERCENSVDYL